MNGFDTTLLVALLFAYLLYRQAVTRAVTRLDFLLPAAGAVYLAIRYLNGSDTGAQVFLQVSAITGIFSGLLAGGLVHVWRDAKTGVVFQHGGWRYAAVLLSLVAVRGLWHVFVDAAGVSASVSLLNDALIALGLGNYLGRNMHVGARALHLSGWSLRSIPNKRDVRRLKSTRPKQIDQAGTASNVRRRW